MFMISHRRLIKQGW